MHRLRCSLACGILVPLSGIEPESPEFQGGFLTTGPPGNISFWIFFKYKGSHLRVGNRRGPSPDLRSLDGYSPKGHKESDTTERLRTSPGNPAKHHKVGDGRVGFKLPDSWTSDTENLAWGSLWVRRIKNFICWICYDAKWRSWGYNGCIIRRLRRGWSWDRNLRTNNYHTWFISINKGNQNKALKTRSQHLMLPVRSCTQAYVLSYVSSANVSFCLKIWCCGI